jgi:hypothetical protein
VDPTSSISKACARDDRPRIRRDTGATPDRLHDPAAPLSCSSEFMQSADFSSCTGRCDRSRSFRSFHSGASRALSCSSGSGRSFIVSEPGPQSAQKVMPSPNDIQATIGSHHHAAIDYFRSDLEALLASWAQRPPPPPPPPALWARADRGAARAMMAAAAVANRNLRMHRSSFQFADLFAGVAGRARAPQHPSGTEFKSDLVRGSESPSQPSCCTRQR